MERYLDELLDGRHRRPDPRRRGRLQHAPARLHRHACRNLPTSGSSTPMAIRSCRAPSIRCRASSTCRTATISASTRTTRSKASMSAISCRRARPMRAASRASSRSAASASAPNGAFAGVDRRSRSRRNISPITTRRCRSRCVATMIRADGYVLARYPPVRRRALEPPLAERTVHAGAARAAASRARSAMQVRRSTASSAIFAYRKLPRHADLRRGRRRPARRITRHGCATCRSHLIFGIPATLRDDRPRADRAAPHAARSHRASAAAARRSRAARRPSRSCASRRRWRRSAGSPAASRTTSTIC